MSDIPPKNWQQRLTIPPKNWQQKVNVPPKNWQKHLAIPPEKCNFTAIIRPQKCNLNEKMVCIVSCLCSLKQDSLPLWFPHLWQACLLGKSAQQFYKYTPDVIDGGKLHALAGGVRLHDARAYAGYLDARKMLHEEACLQHEVHRHHAWPPA